MANVRHSTNCNAVTPYERENSDPETGNLEYPESVSKIESMLRSVLQLPSIMPVIRIPYEDRGDDPQWRFPHGKLLIQYDPIQYIEQVPGQNCPMQKAALEVWFEETFPSLGLGIMMNGRLSRIRL
jgi:hypothetical protein